MFRINDEMIFDILKETENPSSGDVDVILEKSRRDEKLDIRDIAVLLNCDDENLGKIFEQAGRIKERIYGKRVVTFAPLYITNHCVNNCTYCGYKRDNKFPRVKLTMAQIAEESKALERMGHKRIALESGEDPVNVPIDYIIDSIKTIYSSSSIRRINVNIAATTVENYKKLKDAEIGTYILFQETYHKDTYERVHPKSIKGDYDFHTDAFDRAMEAGIDDVGAGVLFGLYDYKYEVLALMMHNDYLEDKNGVGFHTISVPRIKKAEGMDLSDYDHIITDEQFKRVVTVLRIAVPYTGIILSTRESKEMRQELLKHGVSQVSSGSSTDVGGYKEAEERKPQFALNDERTVLDVMKDLVEDGYIPSFCTACYRSGRTGDRFMQLARSGEIGNVCEPNALMTLMEYIMDFGDEEFKVKGIKYIENSINNLRNDKVKNILIEQLEKIQNGERDVYL